MEPHEDKLPPCCPACGHDRPEPTHPSIEAGFTILRCSDCGLGQTWPPETDDRIASWYPEHYYGNENVRFNPLFERMVRWFRLDVPRHCFHFGSKSLKALLSRHRFRIVQLDHFSFEQNPYGILQSLFNALGMRFNLLYSLLKGRSARTDTALRYPFQTVAITLLLPIFLPLTLTLAETSLRSGGTIEVYARKECC